jgi:hypothetical protein
VPILAVVDGRNSQSRGIRGGREASPDDVDGSLTDAAIASERLSIGPEYRSVVTHQLHLGVSLRVFIETKGEGS